MTDTREAYSLLARAARQIGASTPTVDAAQRRLPGASARRIVCYIRNPYVD